MSEEVMTSDSELYNDIVEMLSNGNFLQLNGKAINLTELNEYINVQQEEIERLNNDIKELLKENENKEKVIKAQDNIIKEVREYIEVCSRVVNNNTDVVCDYESLMSILDKENNNV